MSAFRVFVATVVAAAGLQAQKKEDFLQIQRDVAQMQDQVRQLQKSQDEKIAALQALVQQSLEATGRLATSLAGLQTSLTTTLSEQQRGVVAPMAAVSKEVEQMSGEFRSVRENVAELGQQMTRLDTKLADISSAVRTLSAPPAVPPPPVAAAPADPVPPPGVTAEGLFENARRDFLAKRDQLAMQGFNDYLKYFRETENGPRAQYYVGQIYDRAEQYDDAVKAFDAVMERWPQNPFTPEAHYFKAADLMKAKRFSEAKDEFEEFLSKYPTNDNAPRAKAHLQELRRQAAPVKPAARPAAKR